MLKKIGFVCKKIFHTLITPLAYLFFFIAVCVEIALNWLDQNLGTQFRTLKITTEQISSLMEAELPLGSDVKLVYKFFDQHHIFYREGIFRDTNEYRKDSLHWNIPYVIGWIGNVGKSWIEREDIVVRCYLDESKCLTETDIHYVIMGP